MPFSISNKQNFYFQTALLCNSGILQYNDYKLRKRGSHMSKLVDTDEITLTTANEFAIKLVFELAEKYSITLERVFDILDKMNYWRVINDAEVCCELAHDGMQATLRDIEGKFNDILSRNI